MSVQIFVRAGVHLRVYVWRTVPKHFCQAFGINPREARMTALDDIAAPGPPLYNPCRSITCRLAASHDSVSGGLLARFLLPVASPALSSCCR